MNLELNGNKTVEWTKQSGYKRLVIEQIRKIDGTFCIRVQTDGSVGDDCWPNTGAKYISNLHIKYGDSNLRKIKNFYIQGKMTV